MKKNFFTLLIACFALTSLNVMDAALPFTPSTDTGAGAVWYRMKNVKNSSYLKISAYDADPVLDAIELANDAFLFCFVGDEINGFQIYNKAFLNDDAKVISPAFDWYNKLKFATSSNSDTWDTGGWVWMFDGQNTVGGATNFFYLKEAYETGGNKYTLYFRAENGTSIFSCNYSGDDMGWEFEDPTAPIVINFTELETYLLTFSVALAADKADGDLYPKYKAGMDVFQAVIDGAQAIADTKGTANEATQNEVNAAVVELREAAENYRVSKIDLPFNVSTASMTYWYAIYAVGQGADGTCYWTYDNEATNKIKAGAFTEADNQLWKFTGDNVSGIQIYNKATGDLMFNSSFTMSDVSSNIWKIDNVGSEGYGVVWADASDAFNNSFEFNKHIHAQYGTNFMYYGISEGNSRWIFVLKASVNTSIEDASFGNVSVSSQNGAIYLTGTTEKASLYSLTGELVAAFDAETPYFVGAKGIYIVQVNGKAYKVAVQ